MFLRKISQGYSENLLKKEYVKNSFFDNGVLIEGRSYKKIIHFLNFLRFFVKTFLASVSLIIFTISRGFVYIENRSSVGNVNIMNKKR